MSSHPSIGENSVDLFVPDQRIVAGLIQSITTDLFNQSPNLITNVTGSLTDNLLRQKDEFQSNSKMLNSYLQTVYLNHLEPVKVEGLVKDLFKFVFCKIGNEYDSGRLVSFNVLLFFIESNQHSLLKSLEINHSLIERIKKYNCVIQNYILDFIRRYPTFFSVSQEFIKTKTKLSEEVKSSVNKTILNSAIYTSSNNMPIIEITKVLNELETFENMQKK